VFPVPPGTLRILSNATVAPITEERRAADIEAEALARAAQPGVPVPSSGGGSPDSVAPGGVAPGGDPSNAGA
jgi:hypothetical protein